MMTSEEARTVSSGEVPDAGSDAAPDVTGRASIGRVLRDQRKTIFLAVALMVLGLWFGQYGDWILAISIAVGVFLGLLNHLATEFWLLRVITSGAKPTRAEMGRATFARLLVLSVVAVGIAVAFWPSGIGLLLGLAIFRLIALVMTTLPLLKELRNQ